MVVHPKAALDDYFVFQHGMQTWVLGCHEAWQDRQRVTLQCRVVLGNHARAFEDNTAAWHDIVQVAQSVAEQQLFYIADKGMARQIAALGNRYFVRQVVCACIKL